MDRRTFIRWPAGSLCARSVSAYAQVRAVPIVGFLHVLGVASLARFREGLAELGYVEGKNIVLNGEG